ncbi:1,4-alpha-glucan branching protein GlgB [Candidatus Margulisiibacteriota bacterium]
MHEHVNKIIYSYHHNPYEVLGKHEIKINKRTCTVIRAFRPGAKELVIMDPKNPRRQFKMQPKYDAHFFEYVFTKKIPFKYYQIKAIYHDNHSETFFDPYSFTKSIFTKDDLYLFAEGTFHKSYEKLGAQTRTIGGIKGVNFAVWAPNAKRVSVIGGFNNWDGRVHHMRVLGNSGIWEIFIPGVQEKAIYKYEIKTQFDHLYEKIDPYAFASEKRPKSASIVADINKFKWTDEEWMQKRHTENPLKKPVSIYEVHLGSWMRNQEDNRFLTYRELAPRLAQHVQNMGFTHIELLPITEHPFDASWGYQVTNYYAPTSRFGTPEDFMFFVNYMHDSDIGVIMDWVPAHFPRDGHALSFFDGSHLYEHQDPRLSEHKDWGTLIFNYGRNEVRNFLISNALYWFDKYHLDGLRVDAVASMLYLDYSRKEGEWIPNCHGGRENLDAINFIRKTNETVFHYFPNVIMAAEESTSFSGVSKPTYLGGLGFNFKWNMGWMNDFLEYIQKEPIYRKYHQNLITFALLYAFNENFMLSLSHDEVVHGKQSLLSKMPGTNRGKFANMRSLLAFMYGHPGKKLLFMGMEFGQWKEWDCDKSLDWHLCKYEPHQKLMKCISDLNNIYKNERALYEEDFSWKGFEWIDFKDSDNSVISFIRWSQDKNECLIFISNFTPMPRDNYLVGVPYHCYYKEVFNSDAGIYHGTNMGNDGGKWSDRKPRNNKNYSLNLTLPPLSTTIFKPC